MGKSKHTPLFGSIHNCWSGSQSKIRSAQDKAVNDLQQQVFGVSASREVELKINPNEFATVQEKEIDPFVKTRCPFCLSFMPISKFLITAKDGKGKSKGYDREKGKCPQCSSEVQLKTLVCMRNWTLENPTTGVKEYAAWVYACRSSGFWQKIKFDKFNSMLKSMGWQKEFYAEYKRLKGDLPSGRRDQIREQS